MFEVLQAKIENNSVRILVTSTGLEKRRESHLLDLLDPEEDCR